jgi:hypothetical protein
MWKSIVFHQASLIFLVVETTGIVGLAIKPLIQVAQSAGNVGLVIALARARTRRVVADMTAMRPTRSSQYGKLIRGDRKYRMKEVLIGYDAREMCFDLTLLWPDERRKIFLLRSDVKKPLSVDTTVWPSIFNLGQGAGMYASEYKRLGIRRLYQEIPEWIGASLDLWEDRDLMRQHLAHAWTATILPHWIIAVSCFFPKANRSLMSSSMNRPSNTPPSLSDRGWNLLGYDIADGSLLSGLSNCGYSPQAESFTSRSHYYLKRRWESCLNQYHLFEDLSLAVGFKRSCEKRVSEHAPFLVYGLWRINDPDHYV